MQIRKQRLERHAYGILLTALFVAVIVILNIIVAAFSKHYQWYFYVKPQYTHSADRMNDAFLQNSGNEQVDIIFCMEKDELQKDTVLNLVYQTALQMKEKYTFINIDHYNIYLDPEKVSKYQTVYDADGEVIGTQAISKESVIFTAKDRFTVFRMSDFYFLSSDSVIEAYNGEETMAAGIRYVLSEERPIVYFTEGHGEQISSAYAQLFTFAGYDVRLIDLSFEKPDARAEIIVCMNPLYDFEKAAAESGLVTDIENLKNFVLGGGSFHLFLDPYTEKLSNLMQFISSYGISVDDAILRADSQDAVSIDGYTFMPIFSSSPTARDISKKVGEVSSSRLIAKDVAPLILNHQNEQGATVESLLFAGSSATPYQADKPTGAQGEYPFAAIAMLGEEQGGGGVFLTSGIYMTAKDIMQSDQRANRDFFYSLLESTENTTTPRGATTLVFDSYLLEDLTIGEAHRYTRILTIYIPLLVVFAGCVVIFKRKRV